MLVRLWVFPRVMGIGDGIDHEAGGLTPVRLSRSGLVKRVRIVKTAPGSGHGVEVHVPEGWRARNQFLVDA